MTITPLEIATKAHYENNNELDWSDLSDLQKRGEMNDMRAALLALAEVTDMVAFAAALSEIAKQE